MQRKYNDIVDHNRLPIKTRYVLDRLIELSQCGVLVQTLEELADALGLSRRTLFKHFTRLRNAGVLHDYETRPGERPGEWRRVRWVGGPKPTARASLGGPKPPECGECCRLGCTTWGPQTLKYVSEPGVEVALGFPSENPSRFAGMAPVREIGMHEKDDLTRMFENGSVRRQFSLSELHPYPDVEPIRVPQMPSFTGETDTDANLMLRAYKAACLHRYGKRPRLDKKARFRMVRVVVAMREASVRSPYAWANFRLRQWIHMDVSKAQGKKPDPSKPPSIDFVFSQRVVEKHAAYFRSWASTYDVLGRVELAPAHRRLLDLWEKCRSAAASPKLGPAGVEHTEAMVERILPSSEYVALCKLAAKERSDIQAELTRRVAAGEWVW